MTKRFITLIAILCLPYIIYSQNQHSDRELSKNPYWIEMMKDQNANFFETQNAFNKYWKNRKITKGCGWKPFKRWENFMISRVDEFGNKPEPRKILKEYQNFKSKYYNNKNNSNWKNLGPITQPNNNNYQPNGMGRINVIGIHPSNPNELLIGSPSGGLWKTTDLGMSWICLSDNFPTLGVSAIVYDYNNPEVIYIGTGDRDANDAPGLGIMKSVNSGLTWEFSNNGMSDVTVNKLVIHPDSSNIIFAATSLGFYISKNAGISWQLKSNGNVSDFQLKPGDESTIYIAKNGILFRSTNYGNTFSLIINGISNSNRIVIGVSPANPNYVYVLSTDFRVFKGLYFSDNCGESFTLKSDSPNIMGYSSLGNDDAGQAYYDLCMDVDPFNADHIYIGGINLWKSNNKGENWEAISHWYGYGAPAVHADQHFMKFSLLDGKLLVGNDGGIYYSSNYGNSWTEISSGLAISQIYKIGQSATVRNLVMNGYQDNGTSMYNNGIWTSVIGGDGMECIVDYEDEDYKYGSLYYGSIRRSVNGSSFSEIAGEGVNGINEKGAWVTPYMLDKFDANTMYIGMKSIWKSKNIKANSYSISFTNISSSVSNPNDYTIRSVEQSDKNPNILYFARNDRNVYRSDNITATTPSWTEINTKSLLVNDITTDPFDENIVYIAYSNHTIYKSVDKGENWEDISLNLPDISINTIAIDKTSDNGIYVGTDAGIYYKNAQMSEWQLFTNGFPVSAEVTELEIYYHPTNRFESRLRAATYGRGLWSSPLYSETPQQYALNAKIDELILPNNEFCYAENFTPKVTLSNQGTDTIFNIGLISLIDNDTIDNISFDYQLNPSQTVQLDFSQVSLTFGKHTLAAKIISVNEQNDHYYVDNLVSDTAVVSNNSISIYLKTDLNASEFSWNIKDLQENIALESENYSDDIILDTSFFYCLSEDCYKLYVYDEGNNGICCTTGNGFIQIYNNAADTLIAEFSNFGTIDSVEFCINNPDLPEINFSVDTTITCVGNEITFTNLSEDETVEYLWNFGMDAHPATETGFGPFNVSYQNGGLKNITLQATNETGIITESKIAYIDVAYPIEIITQPNNIYNGCVGANINISITTNGVLNYQWYKNQQILNQETSYELNINNISDDSAGEYYCILINSCDTVSTDTLKVVVQQLPEIRITTDNNLLCLGESTILNAQGADAYVWNTTNQDTSSIEVMPENTTVYTVIGTDNTTGCQNIESIVIKVDIPPTIQLQPQSGTVCESSEFTITTVVTGSQLNYKWYLNNNLIENSNSSSYVIENFSANNVGAYKCVVSNNCGSETTEEGNLTISPLPLVEFDFSIENLTVSFNSTISLADSSLWDFGDGNTSNLSNPEHTYSTKEKYFVTLTATNNCGDKIVSDTVDLLGTGINTLVNNNQIEIHPNPNNGLFHINSKVLYKNIQINVINNQGIIVYNKLIKTLTNDNRIIDIRNMPNGLYYIQLYYDNTIIYSSGFVKTR